MFFIQINMPVMAAYNTTDIDVNISSLSQITLYPNYIMWANLAAGSMGGYKNITIKNTGSVNVSNVFGWVDTLTSEVFRPYGSGNSSNYSVGGVLTIRNETDTKYYYIGRIEWNWTDDIPNHDWTALTTSSLKSWGYFSNMSNQYVWVMGNGTAKGCNETGSQFSIETDIDVGTLATRTPDNTFSLTPSSNDPTRWSYAAITSGTLAGHCVAAYYDCSKVYIYNFDKRANFTDCANADYLYNGQLAPGEEINIRIDAWIPSGIPSGNLTRTTLTVEAT
ncbi:MAG: hypothetical protein V1678_00630 [Candidatus Aenigmatarchaeota archaeon]